MGTLVKLPLQLQTTLLWSAAGDVRYRVAEAAAGQLTSGHREKHDWKRYTWVTDQVIGPADARGVCVCVYVWGGGG